MTEPNVSDKLADVITSIFKKTNIFDKIERIHGLIIISSSFLIIGSTMSLINFYFLKNINSKNDENISLLKNIDDNLSKIKEDNYFINFKVYQEFQKKIDLITDISLELQKQNIKLFRFFEEKSKNNEKKTITTMTSMSDFEKYCNSTILKEKEDLEIYEDIENEILQECYDNLPCNNFKKVTSSGFFNWK
jgi:hypothetical protein